MPEWPFESDFSSSSPSTAPRLEKSLQGLGKRSAVLKRRVSTPARRKARSSSASRSALVAANLSRTTAATGVEFDKFARLGVFDSQQARGRQNALARIMEVDAD